MRLAFIIRAGLPLLLLARVSSAAEEPVRFGRDVLPILSQHCFACHGPDESERKAEMRLDIESYAKARRDKGFPIVPGQPTNSLIIERMLSTDPKKMMPPPEAHRAIRKEEVEVVRRWIAQGATWGKHWSFDPIERPALTAGAKGSPIDALISAKLKKQNLALRPAAAPHVLVRRLWLDLVGLPPAPEAADAFAATPTPQAYEKMVDDLLAAPQFGEHWARMWLDLARYADTKGYEKDQGRTMWPYRDWVVAAFNQDMPLPEFTEDQLAGDLLPHPTDDQILATAYHRNTMENDEGGTDDEEYRIAAVKDRVDSTVQVWMGLTMGCAKCHTHKYDPISQAEYYSFYAIFNQTQDADRPDSEPKFGAVTIANRAARTEIDARIAKLRDAIAAAEVAGAQAAADGKTWARPRLVEAVSQAGARLDAQPDQALLVSGHKPDTDIYTVTVAPAAGSYTAIRLEVLPEKLENGQVGVGRSAGDPNFVVSEFTAELVVTGQPPRALKIAAAQANFSQDGWPVAAAVDGKSTTGWAVSPRKAERHVAIFTLAEPLKIEGDAAVRMALTQQYGSGLTLHRFRLTATGADPAGLSPLDEAPELKQLREELAAAEAEDRKLEGASPRIPVMRELAANGQRVTKIHVRGNFLDPGDVVAPGVPAAFGALPAGLPTNRLAVAKWLVSLENPLTPRVWANRVWARIFGVGLVETEEDFGALGALPTHPELLDFLAAEYRDGGWSLKKLLKTIVLSDAYRQASETPAPLRASDPRNQWLSRGPRYRLSAEMVRDQALATAGLLSKKMGGPPVMPPQPAGLWRSTYSGSKWVNAEDEDRWRRGLYTYWKRTSPYPSMTAFDAGSREVCQIRRINSNTPLQALVTLNDPVYLEAAAALARRMVTEAPDDDARAARGLRLALIRPLREGETAPLLGLKRDVLATLEGAPEKADALLKGGRITAPDGVKPAEMAAWMVAASAIMNLDEYLSRN